jgi:hypothetical protein
MCNMISSVDLYNIGRFPHRQPASLDVSVSSPRPTPQQQRTSQPAEPALATWNRLIGEVMQSDPSLSRPEAVSLVARQHPQLRQRVIDEANKQD